MKRNSSLLLTSLWLALASQIALGEGKDRESVLAACPSVARWEQTMKRDNTDASKKHEATYPALRHRLLKMEEVDQAARNISQEDIQKPQSQALKKIATVDAANLKLLKQLIEKNGFPTPQQVGEDGIKALWLITQHANSDIEFQRSILSQLLAEDSGIDKAEIALLVDRINVNEGKPQVYGTQFRQVDGRFLPDKIEDVDDVDRRRAEMGLMPLADYQCVINETYGGEKD